MQELEWATLINGESEIDADNINRLAEYAKALNTSKPDADDVTALLSEKVDKVSGKGLSSNDFTDELNIINKNIFNDNDLFDEVIKLNEDFDPATHSETILFGETYGGIFKILDKNNNFIGILERTYNDNFPDEEEGYYIAMEYFEDLDGVVWQNTEEDGGVIGWDVDDSHKINLKDKIFVSKKQLDEAIGDVETSLENIIQKYGLGGDGV